MIGSRILGLAAVSAVALGLLSACDDSSDGGIDVTTGTVGAGETVVVGKIDRFPGGTAVVTSEHVLVSITCSAETLTVTTSAGRFTGAMDCANMATADVIERFVGKAIVITISETRLKIENPEAGSLDFPAAGAAAGE